MSVTDTLSVWADRPKIHRDTLSLPFHKAFTDERLMLFQLLEKHLLARTPHRGLFFARDLSQAKKSKPRLIKMNSVACPDKPLLNADREDRKSVV